MRSRALLLMIIQWLAALLAAGAALWLGGLAPGLPAPAFSGALPCVAAGTLFVLWLALAGRGGALDSRRFWAAAGKALLAAGLYAVILGVRLPPLAYPVKYLGCAALFFLAALLLAQARPKALGALALSAVLALALIQPLRVQPRQNSPSGNVAASLSAAQDAEAPPSGPLVVAEVQAYESALPAAQLSLAGFRRAPGGWQADESGAVIRYTAGAQWYTHVVFASAPKGWQVELSSGNWGIRHAFTGEEAMPYTLSWYTEPATSWPLTLLAIVPTGLLLGFGLVFLGEIRAYGFRRGAAKGGKKGWQARLFPLLVAALPPLVFMFYFYYQNFDYLAYLQVLAAGLALAALGAGAFLLLARLLKSRGAAALCLGFWWLIFFTFGSLYTGLEALCLGLRTETFCALLFLAALVLWAGLSALGRRIPSPQPYAAASVMLGAMLIFNLVPVTWYQITSPKYSPDNYLTDFAVDTAAPSPNVYWFHVDGMLSFAGVEALFEDSQDDFAAALEQRGFVLNRNAWFESGHTTAVAVLELMSPSFYEAEILPMIDFGKMGEAAAYDEVVAELRNPALKSQLNMAQVNNETLAAFRQKGYATAAVTYSDLTVYKTVDTFYSMADADLATPVMTPKSDTPGKAFLAGIDRANLVNILTSATLLRLAKPALEAMVQRMNSGTYSYGALGYPAGAARAVIGEGYEEAGEVMVRALGEMLQGPAPRFAVIHDVQAHTPYRYDENGERIEGQSGADFDNYYAQHRYAREVLVRMLDMILEQDPEAVIVLQADHGLHGTTKAQLAEGGVTALGEVQLAWNGTLSAVRIPAAYGGLDAPLDPLNISRELVNRYVGENYRLLPPEQPNSRL